MFISNWLYPLHKSGVILGLRMNVGAVLKKKSLLKWLKLTMCVQQDKQLNTYLYFWKKFGASNSLDQSALFCNISSVMARPVES